MAASLTASPAVPSPSASAATAAKVAYLTHKIHVLELFLLGGYCVMFVLCVVLIMYMRYNRNVALRGDASAARKIILPAFEPLLWILGGATGIYTAFFATALAADLYTSEISKVSSEFFYSGRQFVFVSVIVFLFQKSVSIPALRRTLFVSFLLSTYTIPIVWYVVNYSSGSDFYLILMVVRGLLLLLYAYVLLRPPARASKRTLREFCAYTFIYYGLLFSYIEMFRRKKPDLAFSLTYANIVWASMCPLVIWRLLKADTEHWRGLGQRAVALQGLFRQRRSALDERVSSQGFHLLIEMHRRYIIDFAYLDIKHQIGSGASASVFHGVLHGKTRVAVKVYSPAEFDEQTVAAFSHEAALCGALNHPNIVRFYGMCVCPPTICLVSELCGGSLDDVVALAHRQRDRHPHRQQFLLNIGYMIDAARAVAYLHSFSPPFVHRDIKPSNFLVDFNGTVKLTDFGESRSLPRPNHAGRELHPYMVLASGAHVNQHGRYSGNANNLQFASSSGPSSSAMTVRGTVDYMAPEVINGRAGVAAYGEAADIYSLAITMWDVLYPGRDKYPTLRNNHLQIFESVIEGKRPTLDDSVHPSLREVIKSAWQSDPRLRPSAQNIVHILENIQEEIQAVFAAQLLDAMDTTPTTEGDVPRPRRNRTSSSLAECSFSGEEAVAHMIANGFVASACEGVRMGNALMDSGMMHHLHHTHGFGDDVEFYYFDDDNVNLCQPEAPVPRLNGTPLGMEEDEEKSNDSLTSRRSRTSDQAANRVNSRRPSKMIRRPLQEQHGLCACRKLGQNLGRSRSRSAKRAKQSHKVTTRIGTIMEEMTSTGLTRSLLAEEERESAVLHAKSDHVAINMPGPAAA